LNREFSGFRVCSPLLDRTHEEWIFCMLRMSSWYVLVRISRQIFLYDWVDWSWSMILYPTRRAGKCPKCPRCGGCTQWSYGRWFCLFCRIYLA
jgi:hypothetical protein